MTVGEQGYLLVHNQKILTVVVRGSLWGSGTQGA